MRHTKKILALAAALTVGGAAQANLLFEYDASTGLTPTDSPNAWTQSGFPMTNVGSYLLQDWTFDEPVNNAGEYYSPTAANGGIPSNTFVKGGAAYGIEFRTRPLNDVAFVGSAWAQLYLSWADDVNHYNVTIDQFGGAATSGTGDIVYGRNSFSPAITGIDWTSPHSIFIGHRSSGGESIFDFYLDGVIKSTRVEGSIERDRTGWEFLQDRISFGDGTTAANGDVAAEWYFIRVHDTNVPIIPPTMWTFNGGGSFEDAGKWSGGVPDSLAGTSTASFGAIIQNDATITVGSTHTIGHILFDNGNRYTLDGAGTLTFSFPGTTTIQAINGSHTISAPIHHSSPLSLSATAGNTLTINAPSITSGAGATTSVSGAGTVELTHVRGHRLQVNEGVAKIIASATNNAVTGTSKVTDLVIAGGASPTATLDVTNNSFVINYSGSSPETTIRSQLQAGYNAGDWQGLGIVSSNAAAAAAGSTKTAIAYAEAASLYSSFPQVFAGQSIDDNTALVMKYTLSGDANFDESVNTLDFNLLAGGFGVGSTWIEGDFNYDGVVDSGDFSAFIGNYGKTLPAAAPLGAAVPEPALGAFGLLGLSLLRRKGR